MSEDKKITPITDADVQKIINNSVMGEANRLVGNASEQKKMFVRPIANTDGTPSVMALLQRVAEEAERAISDVEGKVDSISTEGLQPSIDQALETASKTIVGAINELRHKLAQATVLELTELVTELPEVGEFNKIYLVAKSTTEENDLYDEWIWVNKGTKDNPTYGWDYIGGKKISLNTDNLAELDSFKYGGFSVYPKKPEAYKEGAVFIASEEDPLRLRMPHYAVTGGTMDYAWKETATNNKEEWTDEERASARELLGAVGFTDYAGVTKAGVVKVSHGNSNAVIYRNNNGNLLLGEPTISEIKDQTIVKAISTKNLAPSVMIALTEPKNNYSKDITLWTDDTTVDGEVVKGTKTKACETIGAIPKNTSTSSVSQAYAKSANGTQFMCNITPSADNNTIPMRSNGNFYVTNVKDSSHCANKKYVDDSLSGKANALILHNVYFTNIEDSNDNDYVWWYVRVFYKANDTATPTDGTGIAEQLFDADYNSIDNMAVAFDFKNSGYSLAQRILGMYSPDGVNLYIVREGGIAHIVKAQGIYHYTTNN